MSSREGIHPPKRSHTGSMVGWPTGSLSDRAWLLCSAIVFRIASTGNSSFGDGAVASSCKAAITGGCTIYAAAAKLGESCLTVVRMSLMTSDR